jgi:hypothetical protein
MQQSRLKRVGAALAALATPMAIFWGVWDHLHPPPVTPSAKNSGANGDYLTSVIGDGTLVNNGTYVVNPAPPVAREHHQPPAISFRELPESGTPSGANPGASMNIVVTAITDIEHPAFEIRCSSPCALTQVLAVDQSTEKHNLPSNPQRPNALRVELLIPAILEKGKQLSMSVRSVDGNPLAAVTVKLLTGIN